KKEQEGQVNSYFDSGNGSNFEGPTHITDSVAPWSARQEKHWRLLKLRWDDRHTCNDAFNRLDRRLLRVNIVRDLLASPQNHNTINHLKYVVDIMGDKDARMPRVAGTANETQYAFGLVDTEIVGGLIEDNQVAVEVHGPSDGDRLSLAAR